MTDRKAMAARFHEDGFAILRGVFSPSEIAELVERLREYIERVVPSLGPGATYYEDPPAKEVKALHNLQEYSEYFRQLPLEPKLVEIVHEVFPQGEVVPTGISYFAKLARVGSDAPAHQDNTFQFWEPPEALTATIAIDESTAENGVLICQQGSHRLGLLPHRQSGVLGFSRTLIEPPASPDFPDVALTMKPGDLSLHHINAVHRSGPNRSGRSRRQLGLGYRSSRAQRNEAAFQSYLAALQTLHAAGGTKPSG